MSDDSEQWMYVPAFLDDMDLSTNAFRIYGHMARRTGRTTSFFESVPNASKHCGMCERVGRKAFKELLAKGLIFEESAKVGLTKTYLLRPLPQLQKRTRVINGPGSEKEPDHPQNQLPPSHQNGPQTRDTNGRTKVIPLRTSHQGDPSKGEASAPPALEVCLTYAKENGIQVDVVSNWHDHFQSIGWVQGKNRIVDWQASLRKWNRNEREDESVKGAHWFDKELAALHREVEDL